MLEILFIKDYINADKEKSDLLKDFQIFKER
jgi:hypothetical protein